MTTTTATDRMKLVTALYGKVLDMKRIIQANVDRFKLLLETTTDPTKRKTLQRLLAEEEQKLDDAQAAPSFSHKTS